MLMASRKCLACLLLQLICKYKSDKGVVGRVAQHAPRVPPGEALLCVKHCAFGPRQVVLKILLCICSVPARLPELSRMR